jgi:hypothetical protein
MQHPSRPPLGAASSNLSPNGRIAKPQNPDRGGIDAPVTNTTSDADAPERLRAKAIDGWLRQIREAHGAAIDEWMKLLRFHCPYPRCCRHPTVCAGRGSCPRELSCDD